MDGERMVSAVPRHLHHKNDSIARIYIYTGRNMSPSTTVKKSLLQDICHHHDHDGPKYNFQPTNHLLPTIIFSFRRNDFNYTTSTGQEFNVYRNTQQTANKWRALRARSQSSPQWPSRPLPYPPLSQLSQIIWEYIRSNAIGEKLSYPFLLQVYMIFFSTLQTLLFFLINVLNSVQI